MTHPLLLSALLLALAGPALADPLVVVVDGDTIKVAGETVRIENLDAPEMPNRAKCASEGKKALEAKALLQRLIDRGTVTLVRNTKRPKDRYGRTLARVLVSGKDVAPVMIAAGVSREWKGRSSNWCGALK